LKYTTVVNVRGKPREEWLKDPGFVYVGRAVPRMGWRASKWGNPFMVGMSMVDAYAMLKVTVWPQGEAQTLTAGDVVRFYAPWIKDRIATEPERYDLSQLWGKRLGCWCGTWDGWSEARPVCHAVILADLAREWRDAKRRKEA
jgi:hypothetical protein